MRFETPAQAAAAAGRAEDGRMMVAGYSAALRILEGDEEVAFLKVCLCVGGGGGGGGWGGLGWGVGGRVCPCCWAAAEGLRDVQGMPWHTSLAL